VNAKKFTFPKISDGVILEYSYTEISPHFIELPRWNFQHSIPTVLSQFETLVPTMLVGYNTIIRGYQSINTEQKIVNAALPGTTGISEMKKTYHVVEMLEGTEKEKHINNIDNYITSVTYEVSSIRESDGQIRPRTNSWKNVVQKVKERNLYAKDLKYYEYFADDIDELTANLATDQEKIEAILNFVKQKIKWNEKKGIASNNRLK